MTPTTPNPNNAERSLFYATFTHLQSQYPKRSTADLLALTARIVQQVVTTYERTHHDDHNHHQHDHA